MINQMNKTSKNIVSDYGWESSKAPGSSTILAPTVIEILKRLEPKRVLDLGAGNGDLCNIIHKCGYDVVGIDHDAKGCRIASEAYPDIPFYRYGVEDNPDLLLEKQNNKFDVVVSTEVIEHLYSPHLLPMYAHKILNNKGCLVISTPYNGFLKNLALSILNKWDKHHTALWHGGHIKFWSVNTLSKLLSDNGFNVISFYGVGRAPYLWKSMILVARKI
jgi:2-polyprenyl-3-methyl-5-hydroxy-6-metoxy-1,4-benzoquinol methylase